MHTCPICESPFRAEIETALFKMTPNDSSEMMNEVAKHYGVAIESLRDHVLFHTTLDSKDSLVRQIKMREADMLSMVALDQMTTVKMIGNRIRKAAGESSGSEDWRFEKAVTKPIVDLYVGASDGLRKNVQTIADINQMLNGPKDDGLSGLAALANALNASRKTSEDPE